jgi:hypothetical protein
VRCSKQPASCKQQSSTVSSNAVKQKHSTIASAGCLQLLQHTAAKHAGHAKEQAAVEAPATAVWMYSSCRTVTCPTLMLQELPPLLWLPCGLHAILLVQCDVVLLLLVRMLLAQSILQERGRCTVLCAGSWGAGSASSGALPTPIAGYVSVLGAWLLQDRLLTSSA